jgi:uncharacterized protein (TIGR00255 family)
MTGFGRSQGQFNTRKITIEIRALNSKQFDLNTRLHSFYKEKEFDFRTSLGKQLERGKIDFSIFVEEGAESQTVSINKTLATAYYNELKKLAEEINEPHTNYLDLLIQMPEVLKAERAVLADDEWLYIQNLMNEAVIAFKKFRADEGNTLEKDLTFRIENILGLLSSILISDENRLANMRNRLRNSVETAIDPKLVDQNRFEQELIFYLEKLDITEEKVRLKTHCNYFIETLLEDSPGRKLAFISQEIGREINTIGSKANDANIQKSVVLMKDELEKIKEQLNNIL